MFCFVSCNHRITSPRLVPDVAVYRDLCGGFFCFVLFGFVCEKKVKSKAEGDSESGMRVERKKCLLRSTAKADGTTDAFVPFAL